MNVRSKAAKMAILCLLFLFSACKEQILHDLGEQDANKVYVVLAKAGIAAEKVSQAGTWSIAVSSNRVTEALTALEDSRVLVRSKSLRASGGGGFLQSREQRLLEIEESLAESLQDTLLRIPGVLEARVHLRLENRPADKGGAEQGRSASVLIVSTKESNPNEEKIKSLVAGAAAVEQSAVTVVTTTRDAYESFPGSAVKSELQRTDAPGLVGLSMPSNNRGRARLLSWTGEIGWYRLLALLATAISLGLLGNRLLRVRRHAALTLDKLRKEPDEIAQELQNGHFDRNRPVEEESMWNTH